MTTARIPPLSIRVTPEERALIDEFAAAAGLSRNAYLRWSALERFKSTPPPRTQLRAPTKDQKALAQLLALFGQSRIANNLNQLAHAANTGSLPVDPDTQSFIKRACQAVIEMRDMLKRALGLRS